jgi:gelsolin
MIKPKEYDVEDSNVEGIGGEEHKALVKKVASEGEPAWRRWEQYLNGSILQTKEAVSDSKNQKHHVEIWRIEKFKVKFWPREQHGSFYSGDSYLILHTFERKEDGEDKLCWDLHFWLGKDTTQDEMGTAAYKTVELDTLLDDGPVQKREVQDHESQSFHDIFALPGLPGSVRYMDGGIDSGFRHVEPESYKPRLMHLKGKKKVRVSQVNMEFDSLNSGDCFILDNGLKIYTLKGDKCGMFERNKIRELSAALKQERPKAEVINLNEGDSTDPDYVQMMELLGATADAQLKSAEEGGKDDEEVGQNFGPNSLWRLSDATGTLTFSKEAEGGDISAAKLDTNDVFVLDAGYTIFAWCGKGANKNEKNNAIPYATNYLSEHGKPMHTPIVRVLEGAESPEFKQVCA